MTRMLASVATLAEAKLVRDAGVDIIDLKDPGTGALGALDPKIIRAVVDEIGKRVTVSATIGDLVGPPAAVAAAVEATAALGVDIVKVGMFAEVQEWPRILEALQPARVGGTQIVAVLLAERSWSLPSIEAFATAGFLGVMLDTAAKQGGSLRAYRSPAQIKAFVSVARGAGLVSGLAGGLGSADVAPMLVLQPDYLGFRGALCHRGSRTAELDRAALEGIRALIPRLEKLNINAA